VKEYATYLFDIDGTLLRQNRVLSGVDKYLKMLRNKEKQLLFVTNTPLKTSQMLAEKLNRLGIQAAASEIVTPVDALHQYLKSMNPGPKAIQALPIHQERTVHQSGAVQQGDHSSASDSAETTTHHSAEASMNHLTGSSTHHSTGATTYHPAEKPVNGLAEASVNHPAETSAGEAVQPPVQPPVKLLGVLHPEVVRAIGRRGWVIDHVSAASSRREYTHVVLGMYMELDCRQLARGLQHLDRGGKLLVLNPDVYCPVDQGRIFDSGALSKMYQTCIPKEPVYMGKPFGWMQQAVKEKLTAPPSQCLFIGDSPYTDIPMGQALHMDTLLLRSGITEFMDDRLLVESTYTYPSMEHVPPLEGYRKPSAAAVHPNAEGPSYLQPLKGVTQ